MKVSEGDEIPGLEDSRIIGPDEETNLTVAEICENELERLYDHSWMSDALYRVDATDLCTLDNHNSNNSFGGYYNSGAGPVEFDKFARATDLTDEWNHDWLKRLMSSVEDRLLSLIRERCVTVNKEELNEEDVDDHFEEEYGYHNAERFNVRPNVYLYVSPDMFGFDVVRRPFTVTHRCNSASLRCANYAIASTRRGFMLNGSAVLYDTRKEIERAPREG